jgi:hypothetical protein
VGGVCSGPAESERRFEHSAIVFTVRYHLQIEPYWATARYTYNGLRGSNFGAAGGPSPGGGSPHLEAGVDIETLFLGLSINRDRQVQRRPSFHYPAFACLAAFWFLYASVGAVRYIA